MTGIPEAISEVLRGARTMRLATVGEDGAPNVAAFWFIFDRDRICFATVENATVRNLRREPRVALVVDGGERIEELRSVTVKGEAAVYRPREAPSELRRSIRAINQRWAEEIMTPTYQAYVQHETRQPVLVEVAVRSVSLFDLGRHHRAEQEQFEGPVSSPSPASDRPES
jgi:nitroimidazol reductase NimA-like FMN-containing flavoprotein (pyridoxamine 5'-phosphate oxidase superfamily)